MEVNGQFHILSKQVIVYIEHAFGPLHHVKVYSVSDVSAVHTASILRMGVRGVGECSCICRSSGQQSVYRPTQKHLPSILISVLKTEEV